jgi:L-aspartate oxidase
MSMPAPGRIESRTSGVFAPEGATEVRNSTGRRVVVVGSGVAGLVTALEAAAAGFEVTVVTKSTIDEGSTRRAQGGIAAAVLPGDSVASHVRDTLAAGAGVSDADAASVLCEGGAAGIRALVGWGVGFDRGPDGGFDAGLEGAHSFSRVLHAGGDATGAALSAGLVAAVRAAGVSVVEGAFVVDFVRGGFGGGGSGSGVSLLGGAVADRSDTSARGRPPHRRHPSDPPRRASAQGSGSGALGGVVGVVVKTSRGVEVLSADAVVVASGGIGQVFSVTTNSSVATGDGAAAALRAGAVLADVEFVQFHPTALAVEGAFLVSEAVRGDGAVLRNAAGERFMVGVHPRAELAPRDVVARAIAAETARTGAPVYLDATALGADELERRFPTISAACRAHGFDWAREPVPVAPAAHYWMGGIATDLHGRTSVPGLYAVGEVACTGVHGANRLASNSLLEGVVFARRCAAALAADVDVDVAESPVSAGIGGVEATYLGDSAPAVGVGVARGELQGLMQRVAGVVRDEAGLQDARAALEGWRVDVGDPSVASVELLETANLLQLSRVLVQSALAREESRGAHFRADRPATDAAFEGHLVVGGGHPHPHPQLVPSIAAHVTALRAAAASALVPTHAHPRPVADDVFAHSWGGGAVAHEEEQVAV